MRYIILALALTALAVAADSEFLTGEKLATAVSERCGGGCMLLSPADVAALENALRALILQAHAHGKTEGSAGCRL